MFYLFYFHGERIILNLESFKISVDIAKKKKHHRLNFTIYMGLYHDQVLLGTCKKKMPRRSK